jgi:hypothetical protein
MALDRITESVLHATTIDKFGRELEKHEAWLSDILEMKTVRETFFPDFNGVVKSLGGWGGDFILAVSENDPTDYFAEKGFKTIVPFGEMIL